MSALKEYLNKRRLEISGLAMAVSVIVLVYGLWLGLFVAIPMLNGNYEFASGTLGGDSAEALYDDALVKYKMLKEDDKNPPDSQKMQVRSFGRGGSPEDQILKQLGAAFTALVGAEGGQVPESRRVLASEIKFLAGNVLLRQKQWEQARDAYREALRLNPQHLYAKYNLEMLESGGGSGGAGTGPNGEPGNQPSNGSGKPPRKGI